MKKKTEENTALVKSVPFSLLPSIYTDWGWLTLDFIHLQKQLASVSQTADHPGL